MRVVAGAVAALLSGCAAAQQPDVERDATTFAAGDPSVRCSLLAPATVSALEAGEPAACTEAIEQLPPSGGQVQHTEVWSGEAQVRLVDDTLFLTATNDGRKVAAAGCTPNGDAPYRCQVEGP